MSITKYDIVEFFDKLTDEEIVLFVYYKVFNMPLKNLILSRNQTYKSIYANLKKINTVLSELEAHNEMIAIIQAMFEKNDLL